MMNIHRSDGDIQNCTRNSGYNVYGRDDGRVWELGTVAVPGRYALNMR